MQEVIVRITNNFGNEAIYPVNDNAKLFATLTKTKTLSRSAISKIKGLGFTVTVERPEL